MQPAVPVKVKTGAVPAVKDAVVWFVLVGVIAVVLVGVVQDCAKPEAAMENSRTIMAIKRMTGSSVSLVSF